MSFFSEHEMKQTKQQNSGRKDSGMKANKWSKLGQMVAVMAFIGLAASLAQADNQSDSYTPQPGGTGTNSCGVYYGYAKMTNSTGTFWIVAPTNITSGTLTDTSTYGSPYTSVAFVGCINGKSWCSSNNVTFPATSGTKYSMTVFVTSTPPPTNGQPISLQLTWQ